MKFLFGSTQNLPGETEAAVFVMDDLDEKKRTLYMQKGKFAEKLESGTNNRTFMFKVTGCILKHFEAFQ